MLGNAICDGRKKQLPVPDHVFIVEKHVLHNVKVEDDKNTCEIAGMCKLDSGEFLLADYGNSKIKVLNNNYQVISTCDVPDYLCDICTTGEHEAAVTVIKDSERRYEVFFFSFHSGTLLKTRSIKLEHKCAGLAHHSGNLYVTNATALYVYDMAGGQGRKLYGDETGQFTVFMCSVSPDGSRIYITDNTHDQLVTLDKDGTKLSTLTHPELKDPSELHVTTHGHLFVSCPALGTVVQVIEKNGGQTVTTLAGQEMLTTPRALCYNSSNNSIVFGQCENDNIVELQLKH